MDISSPNMPHRKVLVNSSSPSNFSKNGLSYYARNGFGEQRIKLAEFVANELNQNHKKDQEILERFRKEAEQYRRQLRKNKSHVFQPELPVVQSIPRKKSQIIAELNPSSILSVPEFSPPRLLSEEKKFQKFEKELKKKDKTINKKNKIIKEVNQENRKLSRKIRKMQYEQIQKEIENSRRAQYESLNKIKDMVAQISDKYQNNNDLMQKRSKIMPKKMSNQSTNTEKNTVKKYSEKILKQTWEDHPIISYNNQTSQQILQQRTHIKSVLKNLSENRRRLDHLNSIREE